LIVERQVHKGETGNKEVQYGPGMDKLRQARRIALSQPLAIPEGCARAELDPE